MNQSVLTDTETDLFFFLLCKGLSLVFLKCSLRYLIRIHVQALCLHMI